MTADRLGRFELITTWSAKLQELNSQGECTRHLEKFLTMINGLPGDEVGEIGNHWRRRQKSQRPCWLLGFLLAALLLCFIGLNPLLTSMSVSLLATVAAYALHQHWSREEQFDRELYMRASYVMNTPACCR